MVTKSWFNICMSRYSDKMTPETLAMFSEAESTYVSKDISDTIQYADLALAWERNTGNITEDESLVFTIGDLVARRDIRKFYKVQKIIEAHSWSIGGGIRPDGADPNKFTMRFDLVLRDLTDKMVRVGAASCLHLDHYIKSAEKSIKKSTKWLMKLKATELELLEL